MSRMPKRLDTYIRICRRCGEFHKTTTRGDAVCEKCKKPIGKHRKKWSRHEANEERDKKLNLIKLKLQL